MNCVPEVFASKFRHMKFQNIRTIIFFCKIFKIKIFFHEDLQKNMPKVVIDLKFSNVYETSKIVTWENVPTGRLRAYLDGYWIKHVGLYFILFSSIIMKSARIFILSCYSDIDWLEHEYSCDCHCFIGVLVLIETPKFLALNILGDYFYYRYHAQLTSEMIFCVVLWPQYWRGIPLDLLLRCNDGSVSACFVDQRKMHKWSIFRDSIFRLTFRIEEKFWEKWRNEGQWMKEFRNS